MPIPCHKHICNITPTVTVIGYRRQSSLLNAIASKLFLGLDASPVKFVKKMSALLGGCKCLDRFCCPVWYKDNGGRAAIHTPVAWWNWAARIKSVATIAVRRVATPKGDTAKCDKIERSNYRHWDNSWITHESKHLFELRKKWGQWCDLGNANKHAKKALPVLWEAGSSLDGTLALWRISPTKIWCNGTCWFQNVFHCIAWRHIGHRQTWIKALCMNSA